MSIDKFTGPIASKLGKFPYLIKNIVQKSNEVIDVINGNEAITNATLNTANAGAVSGNCVATEYGNGKNHVTVLTLTDFVIGLPVISTSKAFGNKIYTFPAGSHLHHITQIDGGMQLTLEGAAQAGVDLGIGSTVGVGAIADLTTTMEDYIVGQNEASGTAAVPATAVAEVLLGATAGIHTGISLNTAALVKNVFLNGAAAWGGSVSGNLTATGTIVLVWDSLV